jgi:hypothetical protein
MKNVDLKNQTPTFGNVLLSDVWVQADKPLREYPLGTKFKALMDGHWIRVERGFKWCTGSTFPNVGGDWTGEVCLPTLSGLQKWQKSKP